MYYYLKNFPSYFENFGINGLFIYILLNPSRMTLSHTIWSDALLDFSDRVATSGSGGGGQLDYPLAGFNGWQQNLSLQKIVSKYYLFLTIVSLIHFFFSKEH